MAKLSELEGAVLGLIWSDGPLTAYAIRSRFSKSRASHFSGSAGAIYPLLERLTDAGLLETEERWQGKRASKVYSSTDAGVRALRSWIAPVEGWMAAVEFDPIRTRVHFLAALSPARRTRFVRECAARLDEEIAATQALIDELVAGEDRWRVWGARGALAVLRARRNWIEEITQQAL